jgi:hypothetical protein
MKALRVFLAAGVAAAALTTAAFPQDTYNAAGYDYNGGSYNTWTFDFEGFYVGLYGGGATAVQLTGNVGAMAGVNFAITEQIMTGLEFQAGYVGGTTVSSFDALALARLGFMLSPQSMVYAEGGGGWAGGVASYAFGAGFEMAATDFLGVRADVLALGPWAGAINGARGTIGLVWHVQ